MRKNGFMPLIISFEVTLNVYVVLCNMSRLSKTKVSCLLQRRLNWKHLKNNTCNGYAIFPFNSLVSHQKPFDQNIHTVSVTTQLHYFEITSTTYCYKMVHSSGLHTRYYTFPSTYYTKHRFYNGLDSLCILCLICIDCPYTL